MNATQQGTAAATAIVGQIVAQHELGGDAILMLMDLVLVVFLIASAFATLLLVAYVAFFSISVFFHWVRSFLGRVPVSLFQLFRMRLRGVPAGLVVGSLFTLVDRGHKYDPRLCHVIESAFLAQRGLIHTASQLADVVEKQKPDAAK